MLTKPAWTDKAPLPGGNFPMDGAARLTQEIAARFRFLEPQWAARLARCYGTITLTMLDGAARLEDCGRHFGSGLTEREVLYLMDREWARSADDVL